MRETESLLLAAQNNAIRTNYIKGKIDQTQQNRKCKLRGDRDETINHIISECSKLEQKANKIRHIKIFTTTDKNKNSRKKWSKQDYKEK